MSSQPLCCPLSEDGESWLFCYPEWLLSASFSFSGKTSDLTPVIQRISGTRLSLGPPPKPPKGPQSLLARILQGHPNLWTGFQGQRPQGASLAFQLKVSDSRRERGQEKEGPPKGGGTEGTQANSRPLWCSWGLSRWEGTISISFPGPQPLHVCPQYWAWGFQPSFLESGSGLGRNETFSRRPLLT